jgi:hypothetical protein
VIQVGSEPRLGTIRRHRLTPAFEPMVQTTIGEIEAARVSDTGVVADAGDWKNDATDSSSPKASRVSPTRERSCASGTFSPTG